MRVRETPPFAPVLMESTRAIGYSLEAAIADIIDNSITAKAGKVQLSFFPVGDAYVCILDNGSGMDDAQIDVAMQYGSRSPMDERDASDLGRYGLGLKTASLSQCRVLTVISKQGDNVIGRRWDLDYIIETGSWSLLILDEEDMAAVPHISDLREQESGTLVVWQNLDRLLMGEVDYEKSLGRKMDEVRQHLELVFHRYLSGEAGIKRLEITFNGVKIKAADPFLLKKSTQAMDTETLIIRGKRIMVKPYILPHVSKMTETDYYAGELNASEIKARIEPSIMIQRMLSKAMEIHENDILVDAYTKTNGIAANIRSFAVFDYIQKILEAPENNYTLDSDVLCAADFGAPQKRMRFVIMGIKKDIATKVTLPIGSFTGKEYRSVRDAIGDLEDVMPVYDLTDDADGIMIEEKDGLGDLAQALRNTSVLKNHIMTKTTETAMERFRALKQGENFHALDESLKTNTYTDASRTQNTIYLRLNYDEPSGTVVNVRKSMWIHPTLDRAISVREAARLQTFPDSFVFCGSKDKQYQQVGNAVPPIMAKSIAKKLAQILTRNLERIANESV